MSTPRLISRFTVAGDGGATAHAKLPTDLRVGSHTVVVTVGEDAASLGFRVVGRNDRRGLPVTGPDVDLLTNWALAILVAGVLAAAVRRRGVVWH